MNKKNAARLLSLVLALIITLAAGLGLAQERTPDADVGGSFTYQGHLTDGDKPANGEYDLKFQLYDAPDNGAPVGTPVTVDNKAIADGLFSVVLAFSGIPSWEDTWLEVSVRPGDSDGAYTPLTPLQEITPSPWALYAEHIPLAGNGSAETAARADHTHPRVGYEHVLVVAKSGGDFTSIQAALDSIADNDEDNRYLVWVAPGTYAERVTMKEYVDIEGAGETLTKIVAEGSTFVNTGAVIGADHAELRFLTVSGIRGLNPIPNVIGVFNSNTSPRLTHVTVTASGGNINYAIYNAGSSAVMKDVSAAAKGGIETTANYGVYNSSSSPVMMDMDIVAEFAAENRGVVNSDSSADIRNCTIETTLTTGSAYGIYNTGTAGSYMVTVHNSEIKALHGTIRSDSEFTTRVAATKLDGGTVVPNGGTVTCAGVYDENYAFSASTCP